MTEEQGISMRRERVRTGRTGSSPGSVRSTRNSAADEDLVRITIKVPKRARVVLAAAAAEQRRSLSDLCRDALDAEVARLADEIGISTA